MPTQADLDAAAEKAATDALLRREVEDMRKLVDELKADRDKFLRWGVIVLGGAVVTLGKWLFDLLVKR